MTGMTALAVVLHPLPGSTEPRDVPALQGKKAAVKSILQPLPGTFCSSMIPTVGIAWEMARDPILTEERRAKLAPSSHQN